MHSSLFEALLCFTSLYHLLFIATLCVALWSWGIVFSATEHLYSDGITISPLDLRSHEWERMARIPVEMPYVYLSVSSTPSLDEGLRPTCPDLRCHSLPRSVRTHHHLRLTKLTSNTCLFRFAVSL